MASRILVSSSPARPTNGRPVSSSVRPGPSPMTTSRAVAGPSPGTVFVRPSQSLHLRQAAMSVAMSSRLAVRWIGSFANRSPLGGSNEIPGLGAGAWGLEVGDSGLGLGAGAVVPEASPQARGPRENHRIPTQQPLLLQVFDCESPAI